MRLAPYRLQMEDHCQDISQEHCGCDDRVTGSNSWTGSVNMALQSECKEVRGQHCSSLFQSQNVAVFLNDGTVFSLPLKKRNIAFLFPLLTSNISYVCALLANRAALASCSLPLRVCSCDELNLFCHYGQYISLAEKKPKAEIAESPQKTLHPHHQGLK